MHLLESKRDRSYSLKSNMICDYTSSGRSFSSVLTSSLDVCLELPFSYQTGRDLRWKTCKDCLVFYLTTYSVNKRLNET